MFVWRDWGKCTENLIQERKCPGRGLKPEPMENKTGVIPVTPSRSGAYSKGLRRWLIIQWICSTVSFIRGENMQPWQATGTFKLRKSHISQNTQSFQIPKLISNIVFRRYNCVSIIYYWFRHNNSFIKFIYYITCVDFLRPSSYKLHYLRTLLLFSLKLAHVHNWVRSYVLFVNVNTYVSVNILPDDSHKEPKYVIE